MGGLLVISLAILMEVLVANAIIGGNVAVTTTAQNVTDLLSLSQAPRVKKLTVKLAKGAANVVYLGDSDVTSAGTNAHVELDANQSYEYFSGESHRLTTDDVYISGTEAAENIVFINGIL